MFTLTIGASMSGCASSGDPNIVVGRMVGAGVATPTDSIIYTQPAGAGVQITSSAGGGRLPAALSGPEAIRLVNRMEGALGKWSDYEDADPFEETIMIGLAGTSGPQPFTVMVARTPAMDEPVFLVTLASQQSVASVALDKANARKWIVQLKRALTY